MGGTDIKGIHGIQNPEAKGAWSGNPGRSITVAEPSGFVIVIGK